jgi:hypothetical protein
MLISYLVYTPTLKIEAIYSSETTLDFHLITWNYISGDTNIHNAIQFLRHKAIIIIIGGVGLSP